MAKNASRDVKEKRINSLAESKEKFQEYVEAYYRRPNQFPNSSLHFHRRVIETIRIETSRNDTHENLFLDINFLELVYAALATWGMDRMGGKPRLVSFEEFKQSVLDNLALLQDLCKYKLHRLNQEELHQVKAKLITLFENLNVMDLRISKSRLVGVSKALHHLLPDLVMPIDRTYTLVFFYNYKIYNTKKEKQIFEEIFDDTYRICKKLDLNENDLKPERKWDTSIPKLIDNAIIGFVVKEVKGGKQ